MDSKAFKKRHKVRHWVNRSLKRFLSWLGLVVEVKVLQQGNCFIDKLCRFQSCATGHNTRIYFSFRVQWEHFEMKAAEQSFPRVSLMITEPFFFRFAKWYIKIPPQLSPRNRESKFLAEDPHRWYNLITHDVFTTNWWQNLCKVSIKDTKLLL